MTELFQEYFVMALEAGVVILIVICIRPLFKHFSNRIACLLWLVVLFRLLCPYVVEGQLPAFWRDWENVANEPGYVAQGAALEGNGGTVSMEVAQGEDTEVFGNVESHGNPGEKHIVEAMQNQGETQGSSETTQKQGEMQGSSETMQNQGETQGSSETTQKQGEMQGSSETTQKQGVIEGSAEAVQNPDARQESSENLQNESVIQSSNESAQNQGSDCSGFEKIKTYIGQWTAKARKWYHSTSGKSLTNVLGVIWLFFAVLLSVWTITKYLKTRLKLREAVPNGEWNGIPVLESDVPGVPMSFGIIRAKIYVPGNFASKFSDEQRNLILLHEGNHIKRHDPLWKLLALLTLCIHWWNPLVWLAYFLSAKDVEMACDEGVMNQIGDERRKEYANTLLRFAGLQSGIFLPATFGESNAEMRIKNVLRYKKPPVILTILLLSAVLVMGGCLATKPADSKAGGEGNVEDSLTEENGHGAEAQDQLDRLFFRGLPIGKKKEKPTAAS